MGYNIIKDIINSEVELSSWYGPGTGTVLVCICGIYKGVGNVEGGTAVGFREISQLVVRGLFPLHRHQEPGSGSQMPYVRSIDNSASLITPIPNIWSSFMLRLRHFCSFKCVSP